MTKDAERKLNFAHVVDANTRVLVLGSLPRDASLKATQYYAHPQNAFWRLIGGVIGHDLTTLGYEEWLTALRAAGIGLWDVIASAERSGSLDAAIRAPKPADLLSLIADLPCLAVIGFNGATAARLGRRTLAEADHRIALIDLPSSSPAYTIPLANKAAAWAKLGAYLAEA